MDLLGCGGSAFELHELRETQTRVRESEERLRIDGRNGAEAALRESISSTGIWNGTADWADGQPLEVVQGIPEASLADAPAGTPNQAGFAPNYDPGEVFEIAQRLMKNM